MAYCTYVCTARYWNRNNEVLVCIMKEYKGSDLFILCGDGLLRGHDLLCGHDIEELALSKLKVLRAELEG